MTFDIKEALVRVGCAVGNDPDDITYKPKFVIFDYVTENLRKTLLKQLLFNYESNVKFINNLSMDNFHNIRKNKIDLLNITWYDLKNILKPILKEEAIPTISSPVVKGRKAVENGSIDLSELYQVPDERVQCDSKWGDKHKKVSTPIKSGAGILESIAKDDFVGDYTNKNSCNTDFSLTNSFNKERLEIDRENAKSICQAEDEMIMEMLDLAETHPYDNASEINERSIAHIAELERKLYNKSVVKREKSLVEAADFIKKSAKEDEISLPICFYNPATKDIYSSDTPKDPMDLPIDFSKADDNAKINFMNLLVKKEQPKEEEEVKPISKTNKTLKFDTGPFDTSAALKRAGVYQSKEDVEDIKKKVGYFLDVLKKDGPIDEKVSNKLLKDLDDSAFIEKGTTIPTTRNVRKSEDIKEANVNRLKKLNKEFSDACETFSREFQPLPSTIKNNNQTFCVNSLNNISEVEIMAASKLPKIETPIINEQLPQDKTIEQKISETKAKLKKFTTTVKSAFLELIK